MNFTESWLTQTLEQWGVDISSWWSTPNKSVSHLLDEINNEEAGIICFKGDVSRCVYVSTGDVYYRGENDQLYWLKEVKQVFPDGTEKIRVLDSSISEKSGKHEDDMVGIIRAVKEELWLTSENIKSILNNWIEENSRESGAYPGLITKYILARFEILLEGEIDTEKGFKEVQKEKTIYFSWEAIEDREISI